MPRLNSIVPLVGSLLLSRGGRRLAGRHAGKLALATLALEVWRNRRQKAGQTQDQTTSEPRPPVRPAPSRLRPAPEDLEPRRKQRLSRERDPIEARIDLHGFGRFEAEDQLRAFLTGCQARGLRAVLVITGQGRLGGGIIRASFAEWMQSPALRGVVSGFTSAHRRHGGDGAFYVTLKRRG